MNGKAEAREIGLSLSVEGEILEGDILNIFASAVAEYANLRCYALVVGEHVDVFKAHGVNSAERLR